MFRCPGWMTRFWLYRTDRKMRGWCWLHGATVEVPVGFTMVCVLFIMWNWLCHPVRLKLSLKQDSSSSQQFPQFILWAIP